MDLLTLTDGARMFTAPAARIRRVKARLSGNWITFPANSRSRENWRNREWDIFCVEAV